MSDADRESAHDIADAPAPADDPPVEYREPVAGLLLAAGGGTRLGGRPKALLRIDGTPLAVRALRTLRAAGCDPIHVVTGAAAQSVERTVRSFALADRPRHGSTTPAGSSGDPRTWREGDIVMIRNQDWRSGMGSSLRRGLASLPGTCSAVVVLLVDQPAIGSATVRQVIDAHVRQGATIAMAAYRGRCAHPVLFAREHWDEIASTAVGDTGARAFLAERTELVTVVPAVGDDRPDDIDTLDDLNRFGAR